MRLISGLWLVGVIYDLALKRKGIYINSTKLINYRDRFHDGFFMKIISETRKIAGSRASQVARFISY